MFGIGPTAPSAAALPIVDVVAPADLRTAAEVRAAVGVSDEDGMLQWVELSPEDEAGARDPAVRDQMLALLQRMGCSQRALVVGDVRAYPGGSLDTAAQPAVAGPTQVRLVRDRAPGARPMFEAVEIVPQSVWYTLQAQRVKWRPTLAPPDKEKAAAAASASGAPSAGSAAPTAPRIPSPAGSAAPPP